LLPRLLKKAVQKNQAVCQPLFGKKEIKFYELNKEDQHLVKILSIPIKVKYFF
jgi:hypothetical protein